MSSRLRKSIVGLILLWVLGAGLFLAWKDSPTSDEGIHISSAYLALTRGEFRFDPEHPYLFKFLTAIPVLFLHTNLPKDDQQLWQRAQPLSYDSWREARAWSDEWLYESGNNVHEILFWARFPAVLCLVALCYLIYAVARKWFNEKIALAALFFTAFNPTLLAHGHLANTDVPVALGIFATVASLWWYGKQPTAKRAAVVGILGGIANLTKFTGIALVIIVPLWLLYLAYHSKKHWFTLGHAAIMTVIAWLLIWAQYLFPLFLHPSTAHFPGPSQLSTSVLHMTVGKAGSFLFRLRWLFPQDYIKGLLLVLNSTEGGRPTYLLGHVYPTGTAVPFYFPIIYALKTQTVGLLLLVVGICLLIRYGKTVLQKPLSVLLFITTVVILYLSITSRLDIGIRHIAPLLVLASLAMGWVFISLRSQWYKGAIILLYMLPVFLQFNALLGFSNILVQPYNQGYRYFNDSNLEWYEHSEDIADYIKLHYAHSKIYSNYATVALNYYGAYPVTFNEAQPPSDAPIIMSAAQLSTSPNQLFHILKPIDNLDNYAYVFKVP